MRAEGNAPRDARKPGLAVLALTMLAACGAKPADPVEPQEAADWLHRACGVTFAEDPVVLKTTPASSETRRTSSVAVNATVSLPESEVASALEALRNNPTLHSRGQSATRFSFESFPDAGAHKLCELDTSLQVLYFSYTE
jgi:hypothetical protein